MESLLSDTHDFKHQKEREANGASSYSQEHHIAFSQKPNQRERDLEDHDSHDKNVDGLPEEGLFPQEDLWEEIDNVEQDDLNLKWFEDNVSKEDDSSALIPAIVWKIERWERPNLVKETENVLEACGNEDCAFWVRK